MQLKAIWSLKHGAIDVEWDDDPKMIAARAHINGVIGFRLAEMRTSARVTQDQLAHMLGVHRNTISRWEAGEGEMDAASLYMACAVMDFSPTTLLRYITPPVAEDTKLQTA